MKIESAFLQFLKKDLELDPRQLEAVMKDAARDRIAYRILITAPAGSGKTRVLAARYLKLLVDGEKPENIVAITFTRKAAGEMKERIVDYLLRFKKVICEKKVTEGEFAQNLQDRDTLNKMILGMRISTIDAFLSKIIRLFPQETGIDPHFVVIDEIGEEELIDSVIDDTIEERVENDRGLFELLQFFNFKYTSQDFDRFCFLASVKKTIKNWEMYGQTLQTLGKMADEEIERGIREYIGSGFDFSESLTHLTEMGRKFTSQYDGDNTQLNDFITYITRNSREILLQNVQTFTQFSDLFVTQKMEIRKRPPMRLKSKELRDLYLKLASLYVNAVHSLLLNVDLNRSRLSKYYIDLVVSIVKEVKRRKRNLGVLGIGDLKSITHELLTKHRERFNILYNMDARVNHYLIDEFQDTDPIQWEIFQKLTEDWFSGVTAKQEKNIIPTLFLVGDEKQSIFGFRNADVRIITRIKDSSDEPFTEVSSLSKNYRSKKEIIRSVNTLFKGKMVRNERDDFSVQYEKMVAEDSATGGTVMIIEREIDEVKNVRIEKLSRVIAHHILSLPHTQRSWGNFALLFRDSLNFHIYEKVFEEMEIPFVSSGGKSFFENREISEIVRALEFLENPFDDIMFVGFFLSPLFDHSLSDLLDIITHEVSPNTDSEKNISLYEKAYNHHYDKYSPFLSMTIDWLRSKDTVPYIQLTEKIIADTHSFGIFTDRQGGQKEVNIRKLLTLIETISEEKMNFSFFFDRLHRTIRAREKNAEIDIGTGTFEQESIGVVHLMTVHKAKGLEFPVVIIPETDSVSLRKKGEGIYVDTDHHLLLFLKKERGFKTPLMKVFSDREDRKEEEELKRLFYVALTRAQDELYLFVSTPKSDRKKVWQNIVYESDHPIEREFEPSLPTRKETLVTPKEQHAIYEFHPYEKVIPLTRKIIPSEIGKKVTPYRTTNVNSEMKGKVIHKFFELIGSGRFTENLRVVSVEQIRKIAFQMDPSFLCDRPLIHAIREELNNTLKDESIMEIVTNQNSLNEFQCTIQRKNEKGVIEIIPSVIDKIIFEDLRIFIYDYKTDSPDGLTQSQFIENMKNEYRDQLDAYRTVVRDIFTKKRDEVRTFLVLTSILEVVEVE